MSPAQFSGSEVVKALERAGFVCVSQKGSHTKMRRDSGDDGTRTVIVPLHDSIAPGTLASVLRQAGMKLDELKHLAGK